MNWTMHWEKRKSVAKSYLRKGFLIYEEMRKYFPIYEEADFATAPLWISLYMRKILFSFLLVWANTMVPVQAILISPESPFIYFGHSTALFPRRPSTIYDNQDDSKQFFWKYLVQKDELSWPLSMDLPI